MQVEHPDLEVLSSPLNAILWAMETLPGLGKPAELLCDLT